MAKKRRKRRGLQAYAEEFALSLIYEASSGKVGKVKDSSKPEDDNPVSFRDRRALLDSVTKLLGAQPDENTEEDEDGLSILQGRLNDGNSGTAERGASDPDEV